jgi:hypothetical protein
MKMETRNIVMEALEVNRIISLGLAARHNLHRSLKDSKLN